MTEWTEEQLHRYLAEAQGRMFVFFYTPMCGTCKMTERMLQVILAMEPELPIVKCNVNFCPRTAQDWRIESVPCLVETVRGQAGRKRYRMQAVGDLLAWFKAAE